MQTATETSPPADSTPATESTFEDASFAGLLASLAAHQKREAAWDDEDLADDVATISYERALRAQARVRPGNGAPRDPEPVVSCREKPAISNCRSDAPPAPKPLKNASITIRLSETECAQLRQRAAEAGMTISAYLRSCTLEAESLRAQVKEALAELRKPAATAAAQVAETKPAGSFATALHRVWRWFGRIAPRRRPGIRLNAANPLAPVV